MLNVSEDLVINNMCTYLLGQCVIDSDLTLCLESEKQVTRLTLDLEKARKEVLKYEVVNVDYKTRIKVCDKYQPKNVVYQTLEVD